MAQSWRWCLLLSCLLGSRAFAAEEDFRILHSEAIAPATRIVPDPSTPGAASLIFEAYGRQFDLELQPNTRLVNRPNTAGYTLYRGRVRGLNGSWVRLTQVGNELHGAIWDGQELYAIEPARAIEPLSITPPPATGSRPTMYRLSDVYLTPGTTFCGVEASEDRKTALAAYNTMVAELTTLAATGALTGQIQISVLGDVQFASQQSDPQAAAIARMNVVDGIFSEQLGITILVPEVRIFNSDNNPFTTDTPSDLLNQAATYRGANASISSAGLTHLFTGRNLDGNTVGIAYLSALCHPRNGVSLSESRSLSLTSGALIAAHEIGHNFGAPHDGDSANACASTPQTFLMAPQLNGSNTFSQCSRDQMAPRIQAASCITPPQYADGGLSAPNAFTAVQNEAFDYTFDITAMGALTLTNAVATLRLFDTFTVDSATVPNGNCTSGAGAITCTLGNVTAQTTRQVTVRLRTAQVGVLNSEITLTADNDNNADNNRLTRQITVSEPTPPTPPPAPAATSNPGGGGGGSFGWLSLLTLSILARRTVARRQGYSCN